MYLVGHSLGCGLILTLLNNNINCKFSGIILLAPFVDFFKG